MSETFSRKKSLPPLARRIALIGVARVPTSQAVASQGPGTTPGGASAMTQLTMAIIVYGAAGLVLVAGLIGAVRRR